MPTNRTQHLHPRAPFALGALALGLLAYALALALPAPSHAAAPPYVHHQGLLLDATGVPLDGTVRLELRLYTVDVGGESLWSGSHSDVEVVAGVYSVLLGGAAPLDPALLTPTSGIVLLDQVRIRYTVADPYP